MNFDIPDITENGEKAAAGGQRRKPRRIGALRLGDTLRAVSRHYTATLENKDEDKEAEFYSLSEGEEKSILLRDGRIRHRHLHQKEEGRCHLR